MTTPAQAPFSFAFRSDILVLPEGQVDDSAVLRAHGTRGERPVGFLHLVAELLRQLGQALLSLGAVVFGIDHYGHVLPVSLLTIFETRYWSAFRVLPRLPISRPEPCL